MTDPVHSTRICHFFFQFPFFYKISPWKNSIILLLCKNVHLKWSHEEFSHVHWLLKFISFWSRGEMKSFFTLTSKLAVGQHQVWRAHIMKLWLIANLLKKSSFIGLMLPQIQMITNLVSVTIIMIAIANVIIAWVSLKWAWQMISGKGPNKTLRFLIPHITVP